MTARAAIFFAAVAGMVSVFAPWIHMPIKGNVYGFEIDGWWRHLLLFAVPALLAILGDVRTRMGLLKCIAAAGAAALSACWSVPIIWRFASGAFKGKAAGDPFGTAFLSSVAIGPGPIIAAIAATVVVCAAAWSIFKRDSVHGIFTT